MGRMTAAVANVAKLQFLPWLQGKTGDSRNVHQPGADGINDKLGRFMNAEGGHDVGAINGHRVGAEVESRGDFFIRFAISIIFRTSSSRWVRAALRSPRSLLFCSTLGSKTVSPAAILRIAEPSSRSNAFLRTYPLAPASIACRTHVLSLAVRR